MLLGKALLTLQTNWHNKIIKKLQNFRANRRNKEAEQINISQKKLIKLDKFGVKHQEILQTKKY